MWLVRASSSECPSRNPAGRDSRPRGDSRYRTSPAFPTWKSGLCQRSSPERRARARSFLCASEFPRETQSGLRSRGLPSTEEHRRDAFMHVDLRANETERPFVQNEGPTLGLRQRTRLSTCRGFCPRPHREWGSAANYAPEHPDSFNWRRAGR